MTRGEPPTFTKLTFLIEDRKEDRETERLLTSSLPYIWLHMKDKSVSWHSLETEARRTFRERKECRRGVFSFFSFLVSFVQLIHQTSHGGVRDEPGGPSELFL